MFKKVNISFKNKFNLFQNSLVHEKYFRYSAPISSVSILCQFVRFSWVKLWCCRSSYQQIFVNPGPSFLVFLGSLLCPPGLVFCYLNFKFCCSLQGISGVLSDFLWTLVGNEGQTFVSILAPGREQRYGSWVAFRRNSTLSILLAPTCRIVKGFPFFLTAHTGGRSVPKSLGLINLPDGQGCELFGTRMCLKYLYSWKFI